MIKIRSMVSARACLLSDTSTKVNGLLMRPMVAGVKSTLREMFTPVSGDKESSMAKERLTLPVV